MPYAVRNPEGQITSLHRHDPGVGEELHAQHPDVRAFLGLDCGAPVGWDVGAPHTGLLDGAGDDPEGGAEDSAEDSAGHGAHEASFDRLDADFIRVLEDVIDALTSRNLLNITDLPDIAQTKLFARKSFRERRPKNALDLFQAGDLERLL